MFYNPWQTMQQMYGNGGAMPDQLAFLRGMQPQAQQPQIPQPQNGNGLKWVQGEAGAKSYPVNAGETAMLMDSEDSVFYLKTVDASGMPLPLRIFDYVERPQGGAMAQNAPTEAQNSIDPNKFITREEFNEKMSEIALLMQGGAATNGGNTNG